MLIRVFRLNLILKLLMTKPLVNGFTSACSIYVLFAQFNNFFELKIPKIPGFFSLFKRVLAIFENFSEINFATVVVSVVAVGLLYRVVLD